MFWCEHSIGEKAEDKLKKLKNFKKFIFYILNDNGSKSEKYLHQSHLYFGKILPRIHRIWKPNDQGEMMKTAPSTLAIALALAVSGTAHAQTYSQTVFFGDSLTDTGRLKSIVTGVNSAVGEQLQNSFTTNPDPVWATHLANSLGTSADANTAANAGGTNYAVGGARSSETVSWNGVFDIPTTNQQILTHLAQNQGKADPNALYTVWIGSNDLIAAANPAIGQLEALEKITAAVKATATDVATLKATGAQHILVPNVPALGLTPRAIYAEKVLGVEGAMDKANLAASLYNENLYKALNGLDANIIPANTFGLLQEVTSDPQAFGFSNTMGVACNMPARTDNENDPASTSLACTPNNLVAPDANQTHLFADDIHPSGRTHQILAEYYQSLLTAPTAIGQLPNAILQSSTNDAQSLNRRMNQLPVSKNSVWADVSASDVDSGDVSTDGVNPSVTIGAGFGGKASHTGAYAKFGKQNYQLGTQIDADVKSYGVGVYHRHDFDKLSVNLQAGVDKLKVDTDRDIAWAGAPRTHQARADGTRLHAGVQAGLMLTHGAFSYRPYLGLTAQEVTLQDLVEDQSTLATALRFSNQSRKSLQGEIGVNGAYQVNDRYSVYGGVGYLHEFKDDDRTVQARLLSLPAYQRDYGVTVAAADTSGVTAHLGLAAKLNDAVMLNASVATNQLNSDEKSLTGLVGVQAQF